MANDKQVSIFNSRAQLLHLPGGTSTREKTDKNDHSMTVLPGVSLQPGVNKISAEGWAKAKEHHVVKQWLDLGYISESDSEKEGVQAPKSLSEYGDAAAVAIISSEDNLENVKLWTKGEDRPVVVAALKAQTAALAPKDKK